MTKAGLMSQKPGNDVSYIAVPVQGAVTKQNRPQSYGCLACFSTLLLLLCALLLGMTAHRLVYYGSGCGFTHELKTAASDFEAEIVHDAWDYEAVTAGEDELYNHVPPHEVHKRHAPSHRAVHHPIPYKPRPYHPRHRSESTQIKQVVHVHEVADTENTKPLLDLGKPIIFGAEKQNQNESYSFDDIFDPLLRPRGVDNTWMNDDVYVYRDNQDSNVYSYDVATSTRTLLLNGTVLSELGTGTYFVSPDLLYVLIAYERNQVWRHSYTARYVIQDVTTGSLLSFPNDDDLEGEVLQFARWGESGNTLSFVTGNDLYYQAGVQEVAQRVTSTGSQPYIFNGIPDWVYEEDVVGSSRGHFFSDDDTFLAYVNYNDTGMPLQAWPTYGPKEDVYGSVAEVAYPKAGDKKDGGLGQLTQVTLYVVSTDDVSTKIVIAPPTKYEGVDHYYTRVAWSDDNRLFVTWTNRAQNDTVYMLYDPVTGEGVQNVEFQVQGGWIDSPSTNPWFVPGENAYWTILSESIGNDSWPHVALVTTPDNEEGTITFVPSGEMAVSAIVGYDAEDHYVYFISTNFDPTERHLYRAGTQDAAEPEPLCLTCDFPETCRYVSAAFSETGNNYVESCRGPDVPSYRLKSIDGSINEVLEDNADVRERLSYKQLPTRNFIEFEVTDGYMARADVSYPFNFDITQKYKILLYPYAGPNSQRVFKTFPIGSNTNNWLMHMKSTDHNTVVVSVDARGTIMRSDSFRYLMYRKLGVVEVEDQLAAARYFRGQDYIDNDDKMAMFGWSYGGFVTAKSIAMSGPEEFQCGISIAPVTSKRYYDSAYTERYMAFDLPNDNEGGYNNTDIMSVASQFKGKTYMIGHGTADDNVHFMHMSQLVNALIQEEYQFRQLMYPDENHSIGGDKAARHLYRAMTNFLTDDCWQNNA